MVAPRVYWDTSCFISLLSAQHPEEMARARICEDILHHALNNRVEIWTSAWTIVETIRPKEEYKPTALPLWSAALKQTDKAGALVYPSAMDELERIWEYYKSHTAPTRKLSKEHAELIQQMFALPYIKTVQIEPTIAHQAAQIARDCNMRAGDSLHVASAIARKCGKIHRWDRDYQRTDHLIASEEPAMMTLQAELSLTTDSGGFRLTAPPNEGA